MDIFREYTSLNYRENRYLIHKKSGAILLLNGSAAMFVDLHAEKLSKSQICNKVSSAMGIDPARIETDLKSFIQTLQGQSSYTFETDQLNGSKSPEWTPMTLDLTGGYQTFYSVGGLEFNIVCSSSAVSQFCEAQFAPLSIRQLLQDTAVDIKVIESYEGWAIECDGSLIDLVPEESSVVGRLRGLMLERIGGQYRYSIGIHAAAVLTADSLALLFSAPSGYGKSTLSTYLSLNGNASLGDDSLVVDLITQMVIPFPASAKLAPGSIDALGLGGDGSFDRLRRIDGDFESSEGPVQLFAPSDQSQTLTVPRLAKALIFPKYDSAGRTEIRALDVADVFSRLMISGVCWNQDPSTGLAEAYINFVAGMSAYELNYSSSVQARDLLLELDLL
ncbi:MAG: hypothetical protein HOJ88_05530 [Proteobacteria bacterium]|nr:hypothetical protein [Pseudomonadota bacterium]